MTQVTEAYLLGIKEGREYLKRFPDFTPSEIRTEIENLNRAIDRHSGTMKECFQGQRDFWRNQIKKAKGQ